MASPITSLEIPADALLSRFDIGIITVIQDHQLNITEDVLHRVIIGTALWQRDPMQLQLAHLPTSLA